MTTPSDEELVLRCQAELPYQTDAFRLLVDRYKEKVFAKINGMVSNVDDAQDVAQEVFIRVFNHLPKFEMKAKFSTWLYTITVNTTLNHIEKRKRSPQWYMSVDLDEVAESQFEDEGLFLLMGQSHEQSELQRDIETTLKHLGGTAREIIDLRFFEELDLQTIADKLEIGLSAAKMRLKRAREEFKQTFAEVQAEG